jgi:hypothetical protein
MSCSSPAPAALDEAPAAEKEDAPPPPPPISTVRFTLAEALPAGGADRVLCEREAGWLPPSRVSATLPGPGGVEEATRLGGRWVPAQPVITNNQ